MRKIISMLLLTFIAHTATSQTELTTKTNRNFEFGARSGFYSTTYQDGPSYFGYVTARKGIHEFSFGPSIGRIPVSDDPNYYPYDNGYKLNGIDLAYRISTNKNARIFDVYFQLNYFQKLGKTNFESYLRNYPTMDGRIVDITEVSYAGSQLLLECGVDIKFLKHFYAGVSAGMGGKYSFMKSTYLTFPEMISTSSHFGADFILRTNIGFRF